MDNRRKQTEQKIKDAFLRLLEKSEPDKITIKELCQDAKINRSTFYEHYAYMGDLIREIIREQSAMIVEESLIEDPDYYAELEEIPIEAIKAYIGRCRDNHILHQFMYAENSDTYTRILIEEQMRLVSKHFANTQERYRNYFQNAGCMALILLWMEEGMVIPIEELAMILQDFTRAMFAKK